MRSSRPDVEPFPSIKYLLIILVFVRILIQGAPRTDGVVDCRYYWMMSRRSDVSYISYSARHYNHLWFRIQDKCHHVGVVVGRGQGRNEPGTPPIVNELGSDAVQVCELRMPLKGSRTSPHHTNG